MKVDIVKTLITATLFAVSTPGTIPGAEIQMSQYWMTALAHAFLFTILYAIANGFPLLGLMLYLPFTLLAFIFMPGVVFTVPIYIKPLRNFVHGLIFALLPNMFIGYFNKLI